MAFGLVGAIAEAIMYGPEGMDYKSMSIQPVDPVAPGKPMGQALKLQYWPETITESHEIGWNFKDIPGASNALAQWSSNQGRTFSFEVHFSRFIKPVEDVDANLFERALDPFAANTPESEYLKANAPHNVDVAACLRYLRMCKTPWWKEIGGQQVMMSPPVIILHIPGSQINDFDASDTIFTVLTALDITYTLAFPNGVLRKASASLSFKEIVQRPDTGAIAWIDFSKMYMENNSKEGLTGDGWLGSSIDPGDVTAF